MYNITGKLEISADSPIIPITAVNDFAVKNRVAAVVVDNPNLINSLAQARFSSRGRYNLILAIDFPRGKEYVLDKFKVLPKSLDLGVVDGFDILLTSSKPNGQPPGEIEVMNEIKALKEFIMAISRTYQVRFVIDYFSRDIALVEHALKAFRTIPPTMIRLDHNLHMPQHVNIESTRKAVEVIRRFTPVPVKVSTNVNYDMIQAVNADRYDVSYKTAQDIVRALMYPEEVKKPAEVVEQKETEKTPKAEKKDEKKADGKAKIVDLSGTAKAVGGAAFGRRRAK